MGQVIYQDYVVAPVRTSAILTNSYVAGTVLGAKNGVLGTASPADLCLEDYNQLNLEISFTIGSLTSAEVKIEYTDDSTLTTWYQETFESITGGICTDTLGYHTITATGNYTFNVPIKNRYIRVSAKGTGTVTSSLMAIKAILGTA